MSIWIIPPGWFTLILFPSDLFGRLQWLLHSFLYRKLLCNRSHAPRSRYPDFLYQSGGRSAGSLFPGTHLHFPHMAPALLLFPEITWSMKIIAVWISYCETSCLVFFLVKCKWLIDHLTHLASYRNLSGKERGFAHIYAELCRSGIQTLYFDCSG